jgi:hypothetical protein
LATKFYWWARILLDYGADIDEQMASTIKVFQNLFAPSLIDVETTRFLFERSLDVNPLLSDQLKKENGYEVFRRVHNGFTHPEFRS